MLGVWDTRSDTKQPNMKLCYLFFNHHKDKTPRQPPGAESGHWESPECEKELTNKVRKRYRTEANKIKVAGTKDKIKRQQLELKNTKRIIKSKTDVNKGYLDIIATLQSEIAELQIKLATISAEVPTSLAPIFSVHCFEHNDAAIDYWTGQKSFSELQRIYKVHFPARGPQILWHHPVSGMFGSQHLFSTHN